MQKIEPKIQYINENEFLKKLMYLGRKGVHRGEEGGTNKYNIKDPNPDIAIMPLNVNG